MSNYFEATSLRQEARGREGRHAPEIDPETGQAKLYGLVDVELSSGTVAMPAFIFFDVETGQRVLYADQEGTRLFIDGAGDILFALNAITGPVVGPTVRGTALGSGAIRVTGKTAAEATSLSRAAGLADEAVGRAASKESASIKQLPPPEKPAGLLPSPAYEVPPGYTATGKYTSDGRPIFSDKDGGFVAPDPMLQHAGSQPIQMQPIAPNQLDLDWSIVSGKTGETRPDHVIGQHGDLNLQKQNQGVFLRCLG